MFAFLKTKKTFLLGFVFAGFIFTAALIGFNFAQGAVKNLGEACSSSDTCFYGQCIGGTCKECMGIGAGCPGGAICCPGSTCSAGVCKSDSPGTACVENGHYCSNGSSCCDGVCKNNVCESCSRYCRSLGYYDGSCNLYDPYSDVQFPGLKMPAVCDSQQRCLSHNVSIRDDYCPPSYTTPICTATMTCDGNGNCTQGPADCTKRNLNKCFCFDNKQQDCGPLCGYRCSNEGCGELKDGFLGCQPGASNGSWVCSWWLVKGVNFISLPVQPSNIYPAMVFSSIKDQLESAQSYNNHTDQWESYAPAKQAYSLTAVTGDRGYLVTVKENVALVVEGQEISNSKLEPLTWLSNLNASLKPGWNMVGFPFVNKNLALHNISLQELGNFAKFYWLNWGGDPQQENSWLNYIVPHQGSLLFLGPGRGYWLFKSSGSQKCDSARCGKGLFNLCDEKECLSYGTCYFEEAGLSGQCLAKCFSDASCSQNCPEGQFAFCDLKTNKCACDILCKDSDKGKDFDNFGTAGGQKDFCKNTDTLVEFYCEKDHTKSVEFSCPYGCSNGACKKQCLDSDGGKESAIFGTASDGETTLTDVCFSDNKTLLEAYCESPRKIADKPFEVKCPFGCSDGVCFSNEAKTSQITVRLVDAAGHGRIPRAGVRVIISAKGSGPVAGCLAGLNGECAVTVPAGQYEASIMEDRFWLCDKGKGCPVSFGLDGTRNIIVTVPLLERELDQKVNFCLDSDGGQKYGVLGILRLWRWGRLNVIVDTCIGSKSLREYYCAGDFFEVNDVPCDDDCWNGVCLISCGREYGPGYVCSNEAQAKNICSSGKYQTQKIKDGWCDRQQNKACFLCEQACAINEECASFKCPRGTASQCGIDRKCLCKPLELCSKDGDCSKLSCPADQQAVCGEGDFPQCFCFNTSLPKYVSFRVSNKNTGERAGNVTINVIDKKNKNQEAGNCVTNSNGKCQLAKQLVFSAEHNYWAVVNSQPGYYDLKVELVSKNNSAEVYTRLELEPRGDSFVSDCSRNSDCNNLACNKKGEAPQCDLKTKKCICWSTSGISDNIKDIKDCADQYGQGYFCSTRLNWIERCGASNSSKLSLEGLVTCEGKSDKSCVTCDNLKCQDNKNCFEFKCNNGSAVCQNGKCQCQQTTSFQASIPVVSSYTVNLAAGENVISSPVDEWLSITELSKSCSLINSYFESFNPQTKAMVNVQEINGAQAGLVKVKGDCSFTKSGQRTIYPLKMFAGWNLFSPTVPIALRDIMGDCAVGAKDLLEYVNVNLWREISQDVVLDPVKGYWLNVAKNCTLSCSTGSCQQTPALTAPAGNVRVMMKVFYYDNEGQVQYLDDAKIIITAVSSGQVVNTCLTYGGGVCNMDLAAEQSYRFTVEASGFTCKLENACPQTVALKKGQQQLVLLRLEK